MPPSPKLGSRSDGQANTARTEAARSTSERTKRAITMEPFLSGGSATDDEASDGDLHGLVLLIERRGLHSDDTLIRTRLRRPNLEHFDVEMQSVVRASGARPAKLVEPRADDTARRLELALHEQTHGHRRRVPAAR